MLVRLPIIDSTASSPSFSLGTCGVSSLVAKDRLSKADFSFLVENINPVRAGDLMIHQSLPKKNLSRNTGYSGSLRSSTHSILLVLGVSSKT